MRMTVSSHSGLSAAVTGRRKRSSNRRDAFLGVLLSVALNATGQILFKSARLGHSDASLLALFLRAETWLGLVLYGLSALCWLWVLSRAPLSFAYPILALSFPIVVALSNVLFSESISPLRWAGVGMIVLGVSLLART